MKPRPHAGFLWTDEAARELNIGRRAVQRLVHDGRLKGKKVYTDWMVSIASVEKYKESRSKSPKKK